MTFPRLLLSIVLLLGLSTVAFGADHGPAEKGHGDHGDKAAHGGHAHEPTPEGEVMDQVHEWHFFENTAFSFKIPLGWFTVFGYPVPTRFMIVELMAALLILWLVMGLAKRMQTGDPVQGP